MREYEDENISEDRKILYYRVAGALKSEYENQSLISSSMRANDFLDYAEAAIFEMERADPEMLPFRELKKTNPEAYAIVRGLVDQIVKNNVQCTKQDGEIPEVLLSIRLKP